jgi:hypothetical protein
LDTRRIQEFRDLGIWELKYESFPYLNPSIPKFAIPQFGSI